MKRIITFSALLLASLSAPLACLHAADASASKQPNIVIILIDDMPWFGTPVRMDADMPASAMAFRNMPNVEKLAAQGMTFRNARAAAGMCSPARCSIQTGMMTARHLYSGNGGPSMIVAQEQLILKAQQQFEQIAPFVRTVDDVVNEVLRLPGSSIHSSPLSKGRVAGKLRHYFV